MTKTMVIDASAAAAMLFGEPTWELVAARVREQRLIAPGLIAYELANVCVKRCRREPSLEETFLHQFALRTTLPIEHVDVDLRAVVELANRTRLTAYDASYLWLAEQTGAPLVTLDARLAATAAARAG